MRRPLGCLTGAGLLAALLTAAAITATALASSNRLFSPGKLSAQAGVDLGGVSAHAALEEDCAACHPAFWSASAMGDRCLGCHTEIAAEIGDPAKLHGEIASPENCRDCHTEHRGPTAHLTTVDQVDFRHDGVGFELTAHRDMAPSPLACRDCHAESLRAFDIQDCAECHFVLDPAAAGEHMLSFGPRCLECHDGLDSYGAAWDHAATSFPLLGAHAELVCTRCHLAMHSLAELQRTPQQCAECHAADDIHAGRLGFDCRSCHNPGTWQEATIDHQLTGFPLEASHAEADCLSCHVDRKWWGIPDTCFGCHAQQDHHEGRFGTDCAACHRPTTWADWSFDHNLAAFRLTGAHASVACLACHTSGSFRGTPTVCGACHADPAYHAGMFGANCGACHNTSAWTPASYNGPHGFPMNHGGAGGNCDRCHPGALTGYTCFGCHDQGEITDKHAERFASFSDCMACHPTGDKEEGDD
ncbi:MAG: hypothetical protein A2Y93_12370 [Chloroflexi bacterium RBG_13_68_17]|nr:MAG: hypothetical protein A2Y93_12370 [Chloroflexi bacterium RBG_13_68_17]